MMKISEILDTTGVLSFSSHLKEGGWAGHDGYRERVGIVTLAADWVSVLPLW